MDSYQRVSIYDVTSVDHKHFRQRRGAVVFVVVNVNVNVNAIVIVIVIIYNLTSICHASTGYDGFTW